jgi:hypothetical protein
VGGEHWLAIDIGLLAKPPCTGEQVNIHIIKKPKNNILGLNFGNISIDGFSLIINGRKGFNSFTSSIIPP